MSDIRDTIAAVGGGMVFLAIVVVVLSTVVGMAFSMAGGATVLETAPDTATQVDSIDDPGDDLTVRATTGNALRLDGGGSHVRDPTNASVFTDGGWAVALTADPDETVLGNETTASLYAANNDTAHLLLEKGNWTAHYETASGDTAHVEAPANLSAQTSVGATFFNNSDGPDQLVLYVDGSRVDSDQPDATTAPRSPAYAWIGSLDEVRIWNGSLSEGGHSAYAADPVRPLPTGASARLMFNDGYVDRVYYADGDATLVGDTSLVDGVAGPDLAAGTDYQTTTDPFTFEVVGGGYLDGAPVVFLGAGSGAFIALLNQLISIGSSALSLLVIGLLVAAALAVQDQFSDF